MKRIQTIIVYLNPNQRRIRAIMLDIDAVPCTASLDIEHCHIEFQVRKRTLSVLLKRDKSK